MKVNEALLARKSVRSFLNKEVEEEKIMHILESAKYSPSSTNMQPWEVCVVRGKTKKNLNEKILKAFDRGQKEEMDYQYYPDKWKEPFKSRRIAVGREMYSILKIEREDKESRIKQWRTNYSAFNAPIVLYFFMDSSLKGGSYLDYGMFLQSIMLASVELGLGCCSMGSLAEYPSIVKETLGVDNNKILLCGMALGYEDTDAPINSFRTQRASLNEFVAFYA